MDSMQDYRLLRICRPDFVVVCVWTGITTPSHSAVVLTIREDWVKTCSELQQMNDISSSRGTAKICQVFLSLGFFIFTGNN